MADDETTPKQPPAHLTRSAQLWSDVVTRFELSAADYETLEILCCAIDRRSDAEQRLRVEGLTTFDARKQLRTHPLVSVVRDCSRLIIEALKVLDLNENPEPKLHPRSVAARMKAFPSY